MDDLHILWENRLWDLENDILSGNIVRIEEQNDKCYDYVRSDMIVIALKVLKLIV